MSSVVRSVSVRLSAETSAYIAKMRGAAAVTESSAATMSRSFSRHSAEAQESLNKLQATAAHVGKWVGLSVAGGMILAAKSSADFNAEMATVNTLAHSSPATAAKLRNAALTVGTAWGYTANQTADAQQELVKAGISTKDILGGALKGALSLAAAGQTDVASATEYAAAAMTQFRLKGKDVPHIADLLSAGADKALGSVTDLGYGLSQAGTTAHQAGLTIEQTTGVLAAFAQAGLTGERGGTAFKQMLLKLEAPSKKAQGLMDEYHLSLYKANGQIKSMPEFADNLRKSFGGLEPAQRNFALAAIFGARAVQSANIMMAEGEKGIARWIRRVDDQGFAAHQASGKLDSLKGDLQKLKAEGLHALIDLGDGSQAPLRKLAQNVTKWLHGAIARGDLKRWGNDAAAAMQRVADVAGTVGSGLAPVAKFVGRIVEDFTKLPAGLQKVILTGAVVGYAAKKTGVLDLATSLLGRGKKGSGLTGLAGRAGVVPVFVTNPGFGGPGGFGGGGPGGGPRPPIVDPRNPGEAWNMRKLFPGAALDEVGMKHVLTKAFGAGEALGFTGWAKLAGRSLLSPVAWFGSQPDTRTPKGVQDPLIIALNRILGLGSKNGNPAGAMGQVDKLVGTNPAAALSVLKRTAKTAGMPWADAKTIPAFKKWIDQIREATQRQKGLNDLLLAPALPEYTKRLKSLPPVVQTAVTTPGAIESFGDIRRLKRQYDLTPRQVRTLVDLTMGSALTDLQRLRNQIDGLHDKTVTVTVALAGAAHERNVRNQLPSLDGNGADGTTVPKTGRGYADRHLYLLADGEEVISNRHGQADRHRGLLKAISGNRLASGGTTGGRFWPTSGFGLLGNRTSQPAPTKIHIDGVGTFTVTAVDVNRAKFIARLSHQTLQEKHADRLAELQAQQHVRDVQKSLTEMTGKKGHRHLKLTGLDRKAALAELAAAKDDLKSIRNHSDAIKEAIQQAAEAQKQAKADSLSGVRGSLDLFSRGNSAAGALSSATRMVNDIQTYGQLLGQLRSKNVSPVLLDQIVQHANGGDFAGAIRLMRSLLANPSILAQVNSALGRYGTVTNQVANLTSDPRFGNGKAWAGASQVVNSKTIQFNFAQNPTALLAEMQRVIQHYVQVELGKAAG